MLEKPLESPLDSKEIKLVPVEPQEVEGTTGERVPFGNNASTVYARTNRPPLPRVTNCSL